jgi:sulfide:quinone oxidoreductase
MAINMYTAHSDSIGVDKFIPKENAIVLRNGKRMEYDNLVVAMGMPFATETIKGFEEAWVDIDYPFYVASDYPTWRDSVNKAFRPHLNYKGGTAIFYIPPAPYHGEI